EIGLDRLTGRGRDGKAGAGLVDPGYLGAAADVDPAPAHLLAEIKPQILIEAAQHLLAPDDLDDLAAETVENAGELDRDVAAADNHDAVRRGGQVERLVRRDHLLDAGDLRRLRPAADRDQDLVGGIAPAADLDRVRVDDDAAAVHDLHAGVVQHVDVD